MYIYNIKIYTNVTNIHIKIFTSIYMNRYSEPHIYRLIHMYTKYKYIVEINSK